LIYVGSGQTADRVSGPRLAKPFDLPSSDFRIKADGSAIEKPAIIDTPPLPKSNDPETRSSCIEGAIVRNACRQGPRHSPTFPGFFLENPQREPRLPFG
jgi:hypothetical protein